MFFAMVFALPIQWGYHWYVERKWRATARNGSTYLHTRLQRETVVKTVEWLTQQGRVGCCCPQ